MDSQIKAVNKPIAAIFNNDPDLMDLLAITFNEAGYNSVTMLLTNFPNQEQDVKDFLKKNIPTVIVYHLGRSYDWDCFQRIQEMEETKNRRFVLVTDDRKISPEAEKIIPNCEFLYMPFNYDQALKIARGKPYNENEHPQIHGERGY